MNPVTPEAKCIPKLLDDGWNSCFVCLFIITLLRPRWVSFSISCNLKNCNKHNRWIFYHPWLRISDLISFLEYMLTTLNSPFHSVSPGSTQRLSHSLPMFMSYFTQFPTWRPQIPLPGASPTPSGYSLNIFFSTFHQGRVPCANLLSMKVIWLCWRVKRNELSFSRTSNVIPSSPGRAHGSHKQHIHNVQPVCVLLVKPVTMVNPVPQELNGGLGPIYFFGWHVEVIWGKKPWPYILSLRDPLLQ